MGILAHRPLLGRYRAAGVNLVAGHLGHMLGQCSPIGGQGQDAPQGCSTPCSAFPARPAGSGGRYPLLFQRAGDLPQRLPRQKRMIDAPHHRGGFLIRQKAIFVRRVDAVAIGGLPAQKFAFFLQRAFCPQHLGAAILGIQLVEQKFEHAGVQTIPAHVLGVVAIVHRNVAHTQPLKGLLHQRERLAAVAPQPGKVGGGKAANAAAFQLSH